MYNLKILKLSYKPPDIFNLGYHRIFSKVKKVIIQTPLMQNPEKFLFIVEIDWKKEPDNDFVKEFVFIEDSKELIAFKDRSVCLIGGSIPKEHSDVLQQLSNNFNCFLEFPIIMEKNSISGNIVGHQKDLNKFIDFIKGWGAEFKIISIKKYYPKGYGILSALTKKQLICLEYALEKGYFDFPKRNDSRKISEKLDISHTTFIEHIKKAEKTIITNLLR
ncbi:MAG: helix-turn-helix domain-containing protein [Thermoplasmata archaeon]|nr:MAG: helix-turn-helix domain-containing protein [Thermoplasmata archaeon]